MRITFNAGYDASLNDLEQAVTELHRRQREVSSGRRVNSPSDDPTAAAAAVREHAEIGAVDQYVRSTNTVTSRLSVVDTVLSDLIAKVTAARSSALGAQGTTQTAEQREATARELEGVRDAVFDDMNTAFNGTFLFAGSAGVTPPYTRNADGTVSAYGGDANALLVDVDRNRAMQVTFDGSAVLQGPDSQDLFTTLQQLIDAVRGNDQSALAASITRLQEAFNRLTSVQSGVGSSLNALDDQRARLGQMKQANQTRLSKDEDANMAESITAMEQANTVYQSALGAIATRTKLSLLDYLK